MNYYDWYNDFWFHDSKLTEDFSPKKRLLLKVKNRFIYNITLFTYVRLSTMSHIHRRMRIRFRSRCLLRHHSCKPRCFRLLLLCHL